jgi:hypothetical protein
MTIDALAANRQRQEMRLYRANAIREFTPGGEATKSAKEIAKLPPTPEQQLAAQRVEKIAKARVAAVSHGLMPMKQPEDEYKEEMAHRLDAQKQSRSFLNDATGGLLEGAVVPGNPLGPDPVRRQDGSVHPQSEQIKQVIRENRRAWQNATQPLELPSFQEWRLARGI